MTEAASVIEDVYIKPIKSVLFIDDSFPTYASLLSTSSNGSGIDEDKGETEESFEIEGLQEEDNEEFANRFAQETVKQPATAQLASPPVHSGKSDKERLILIA